MNNIFHRIVDFVRRLFGFKDKTNKYGWLPDLPDDRDIMFAGTTTVLPASVDLRSKDSTIYNQNPLSSCTANAVAGMYQFINRLMGGVDFYPSRLFIYYFARLMRGWQNRDSGSYIRDAMKVIHKRGVSNETLWPYDVSKYTVAPSAEAQTEALTHQSIKYMRIGRNLNSMKQCLADGFPFVFGLMIYESFETDAANTTGIIPVPAVRSEKRLGGHAMMAVGYDDEKQYFIVRNSWGDWWGDKGYCYIPYAYMSNKNLSSDFWTLRTVEV